MISDLLNEKIDNGNYLKALELEFILQMTPVLSSKIWFDKPGKSVATRGLKYLYAKGVIPLWLADLYGSTTILDAQKNISTKVDEKEKIETKTEVKTEVKVEKKDKKKTSDKKIKKKTSIISKIKNLTSKKSK